MTSDKDFNHRSLTAVRWQTCIATATLAMAAQSAQAQSLSAADAERRCGPVATRDHYGPFDYRTERQKLAVVEQYHFTPSVESGTAGSTGDLMKDLGYTLKSSPNHHRALLTLVNLGAKTKSPQPGQLEYSIECWFDRAVRFRADDTIVRMIFAQYLVQLGRAPDAKQQLDIAAKAAGDNPLTHHNIGLVYFEMNEFDLSLAQAHEARKLGFERSRLENLLKQKGKWKDAAE